VLMLAAALGVLALTAGTLAASETAREVVGISNAKPEPKPARGVLPQGASGFAAVAGQNVWLAIPGARRPRVLQFTAFELSPNAIYVAAGRGHSLVALDPARLGAVKRRPVGGTVTAISWAPIGIYIAYIVRDAGRSDLHLMEGNFTNDRVVARDVADVKPSWRWDSLALAYVTARGAVRVLDLGQGRTIHLAPPECTGEVSKLAFAPYGSQLAVGAVNPWIADSTGRRASFCAGGRTLIGMVTPIPGDLAWISPHELVVTEAQFAVRIRIGKSDATALEAIQAPAGIAGIAASDDRRSLALALFSGQVIVVDAPGRDEANGSAAQNARVRQVLASLPPIDDSRGRVTLLWR
jgi:hypothetical protein